MSPQHRPIENGLFTTDMCAEGTESEAWVRTRKTAATEVNGTVDTSLKMEFEVAIAKRIHVGEGEAAELAKWMVKWLLLLLWV